MLVFTAVFKLVQGFFAASSVAASSVEAPFTLLGKPARALFSQPLNFPDGATALAGGGPLVEQGLEEGKQLIEPGGRKPGDGLHGAGVAEETREVHAWNLTNPNQLRNNSNKSTKNSRKGGLARNLRHLRHPGI